MKHFFIGRAIICKDTERKKKRENERLRLIDMINWIRVEYRKMISI